MSFATGTSLHFRSSHLNSWHFFGSPSQSVSSSHSCCSVPSSSAIAPSSSAVVPSSLSAVVPSSSAIAPSSSAIVSSSSAIAPSSSAVAPSSSAVAPSSSAVVPSSLALVSLVAFESRSKASSKMGDSSSPLHPIYKARKAAKTGNAKKRSFMKPPQKSD